MVRGMMDSSKVQDTKYLGEGTFCVKVLEVDEHKFDEWGSVKVVFQCVESGENDGAFHGEFLTLNPDQWQCKYTLEFMGAIGFDNERKEELSYDTEAWKGKTCLISIRRGKQNADGKSYCRVYEYKPLSDTSTTPDKSDDGEDIPF